VAAIKDRAFDYLPKNFSVDQLTLLVERALRQRRLALENRKPARSATDHRGPGNVRELQNVIERACALAEGDAITSRDLPEHVRGRRRHIEVPDAVAIPTETQIAGANDLGLKEAKERWMAVLEASYLRQLLDRHEDNISAAAKVAGIDRKTFHRLVTKHRIRS
jgi:DNA-binding NtrC family response regulator